MLKSSPKYKNIEYSQDTADDQFMAQMGYYGDVNSGYFYLPINTKEPWEPYTGSEDSWWPWFQSLLPWKKWLQCAMLS